MIGCLGKNEKKKFYPWFSSEIGKALTILLKLKKPYFLEEKKIYYLLLQIFGKMPRNFWVNAISVSEYIAQFQQLEDFKFETTYLLKAEL